MVILTCSISSLLHVSICGIYSEWRLTSTWVQSSREVKHATKSFQKLNLPWVHEGPGTHQETDKLWMAYLFSTVTTTLDGSQTSLQSLYCFCSEALQKLRCRLSNKRHHPFPTVWVAWALGSEGWVDLSKARLMVQVNDAPVNPIFLWTILFLFLLRNLQL